MLQTSQKTFLLIGLVSLFLVSSFLFMYHNRALDPKMTGDWWAVRFVSLEDRSNLTFEIENYTSLTQGTYEILVNGNPQEKEVFTIAPTGLTRIMPQASVAPEARVQIIVTLGDKKQSLIR